jgi:hypothetical protein
VQVTYYDNEDGQGLRIELTDPRLAVVSGLRPGEPIFVLRAQDALALATINLWREMAYGLLDQARADAVEADLQAFIEWRHGPGP